MRGESPGDRCPRSIEQGYPIRTAHQKRSRSRVLTASLLWHKQHTMPEPAFALFFFLFSQFRHFLCLVQLLCAVHGLEKLLFPPLYTIVHPSKPRDTTLPPIQPFRSVFSFLLSHSRNYSLPFARSQLRLRKTVSFQHALFLLLLLSTISYVISVKFN